MFPLFWVFLLGLKNTLEFAIDSIALSVSAHCTTFGVAAAFFIIQVLNCGAIPHTATRVVHIIGRFLGTALPVRGFQFWGFVSIR